MSGDILFKEESFKINGACFEVHNCMGSGFLEAVYQECLMLEFTDRNMPFESQPNLKLMYKTHTLRKRYVPDFLCYDKILVEIKVEKRLENIDRAQIINYLEATKLQLGILVNFGHHPKLEIERFVNTRSN